MRAAVHRLRLARDAAEARARIAFGRRPRFTGAFPSREAALAALPAAEARGYDDPDLAEISFEAMCRREVWDYPVVHWLHRLLPEAPHLLDAGGHLGTKRIAFADLLDLQGVAWTVLDTPGIVAAARKAQAAGRIPAELGFVDAPEAAPETDILLASGLLQYLDRPFGELLDALPVRPRHLILNKVALRDGPELVTHERLGAVRVPYRIRSAEAWRAELDGLGYREVDSWTIPDLSHRIATHPGLGESMSRGFVLTTDPSVARDNAPRAPAPSRAGKE